MTALVKWTVTVTNLVPRRDPYTDRPIFGDPVEKTITYPMSREFENLSDAHAFIDAAPSTCSGWELVTEEK